MPQTSFPNLEKHSRTNEGMRYPMVLFVLCFYMQREKNRPPEGQYVDHHGINTRCHGAVGSQNSSNQVGSLARRAMLSRL
jgi:hypothetical protein